MPLPPSLPDDDAVAFDPVKAKEKRAQDAERIRVAFIKSKSQRLPSAPGQEKPLPESSEDEY